MCNQFNNTQIYFIENLVVVCGFIATIFGVNSHTVVVIATDYLVVISTPNSNTFRTTEKRTPLNSVQRMLMSPRLILVNIELPPKTDSETTHTNGFVHSGERFNSFRKIVRWVQRPGIILHYIVSPTVIGQLRWHPLSARCSNVAF